jgi:hypothetical protein
MALTLLFVGPALAVGITNALPIDSDGSPQGTAEDCAEFNVQPGQVVWHFVAHTTDPNETLTATFTNAGTFPNVTPYKTVDHYELHFAITTGSPDTLTDASTTGDGNLQLSHICDGGPGGDVPEAPASVLLLLTAGLAGLAYVGWRMRTSTATA